MKQVNHARDIKTISISAGSIGSCLSAYDTWRAANPSVVVPEGGVKLTQYSGTFLLNSNRSVVKLTGATLALLETAYNDWKAANPTLVVDQESFAIDSTGGAVSYNMIVSYTSSINNFINPTYAISLEYYVNSEFKQ